MHSELCGKRRLGAATRVVRRGALAGLAAGLITAAVALAAPGSPVSGFGADGVGAVGAGVQVLGVAAEPDGSTVVAGQSGGKAIAERLSAGGKLENTWTGPGGSARAVAVDKSGDVAVAGTTGSALFVERLSSSLQPAGSFGSGGQALAFSGDTGAANAVGFTPSGGVVAAGSVGGNDAVAVAAGFSAKGAQQWSYDFGLPNSTIHGLAVQSNGATVLVGSTRATQIQSALIARLTSAGKLDGSFHGTGEFTYVYPASGLTVFNAATVQSDGKIVLAGSAAEGPTTLLARLNSDGQFDSSFGHGGLATASAGEDVIEQNFAIGAYGISLGAGGTIVAAGSYEDTGAIVDEALWAFTSSGTADTGFGSHGTVLSPQGASEACAVATLPGGDFVTAGDSTQLPDAEPCTVRLGSQGFAAEFTGFGAITRVAALKAWLTGIRRSYKKASAHRGGISFGVKCNEACKATAVVKLKRRKLQTARVGLARSGKKTIALRSKAFKRAVRSSTRTVKLSLTVTVVSSVNGKRVTLRKTLSFK